MPNQRFASLIFVISAVAALGGCQSSGADVDPENVAQPASAVFRCSGGQSIEVENLGGKVNVTKPDGTAVELPSLPAGSRSRYSEGQTALVFNGREALFMVTGKPPLECKR